MFNKNSLNDFGCTAGEILGRFNKLYIYDRLSINRRIIDMLGGKERLFNCETTGAGIYCHAILVGCSEV